MLLSFDGDRNFCRYSFIGGGEGSAVKLKYGSGCYLLGWVLRMRFS